jgi:hypothetical protein
MTEKRVSLPRFYYANISDSWIVQSLQAPQRLVERSDRMLDLFAFEEPKKMYRA